MNTYGRIGTGSKSTAAGARRGFRLVPVAQAIALMAATGVLSSQAHAGPAAFSSGWFAAKGAAQSQAQSSGLMPGGALAGIPSSAQQQQQSRQQLQQSVNNLNRVAAAIATQQAAQAAARTAALTAPSDVPDGLADGGLKIDTNALTKGWLNANAPTQTTAGGKTTVAVQQTADKAILNWETFNVGKNTTVAFQQQADWAVLNRVNDPAARPSRIQGQVTGAGTVMILNRNGIVFSGSSQVNVRNLVAAAANMSDAQFTDHGIYSALDAGAYTPSFTDAAGKVMVEAGAQITTSTPGTVKQGGGYALLFGREVVNAGAITTPQGQVEMAAGDFFIVRAGQGTDSNAYSTTRGNEVVAGFNTDSAGKAVTAADGGSIVIGRVANSGLLQAPEGDITLTGHQVVQDGVALSTTSVNTRGTIHLLTSASDATGTVELTGNAVNAILLQDDGSTALDSQRAALITDSAVQDNARRTAAADAFDNLSRQDDRRDQSRVEIVSGGDVSFGGGSSTLATGGQIVVTAGKSGRATVADGATLDVAGAVGVQVSMASNNVKINVQGNEQRDSPLNRDLAYLNNSDVWIDRRSLVHVAAGVGGDPDERWYTAGGLLEVGGYLGLAGHTIGEWNAQGGTITVAGGELVTQRGSAINISGGTLDTQGGYLQQTWLRGTDGRLYSLASAPADVAYASLYKGYVDAHARWGDTATRFFYNPLIAPRQRYEDGYTTGRDAGSLVVSTNAAVLEGDVDAQTWQGPRQTQTSDASLQDGYDQSQNAVARGGQLVLGSYLTAYNADAKSGPAGISHNLLPTQQAIVFGVPDAIADTLMPSAGGVAAPLPEDRQDVASLDSNTVNGWKLGRILAAANDSLTVDQSLQVVPGGTIELHAPSVNVNGDLIARGGQIELGNILAFVSQAGLPGERPLLPGGSGAAAVTLAPGVTLDARGLWTNLQDNPADISLLPYKDGGDVAIRNTNDVTLAAGTVIDVSSGAVLKLYGSIDGGKAGSVTLSAGDDAQGTIGNLAGTLTFDGAIRGYGVAGGGTLTIATSRAVGIGAALLRHDGELQTGEVAPVNLQLAEDYVIHAGDTIPYDISAKVKTLQAGQALGFAVVPAVTSAAPLKLAADWTVPAGVSYIQTLTGYYYPGRVVPGGETIVLISGSLPANYTLPADAFPHGLSITPVTTTYRAGTVAGADAVIAAGTELVAGSALAAATQVQPSLTLDSDLFQTGFAHYSVQGQDGVAVGAGVQLNVRMPVLRADPDAARFVATGADTASVLPLWTPPLYEEDPVHALLTQRAGASLALASGGALATGQSPLAIGQGAVIAVDPGQTVDLHSDGQLTIEGRIDAWGGKINLASKPALASGMSYSATRSVWIGDDAVLDVSGHAYVAQDNQGRAYGVALDGGAIVVGQSDAYVIVRPGAVLDASGASAVIDTQAGASGRTVARPLALAGNGGTIELHSNNGLYLDGTLRAQAGGAGAQGGSLALYLQNRVYDAVSESLDPSMNRYSIITLTQQADPDGLDADLAPGQGDSKLVFGQARLGADQVAAGGFDALTLSTPDVIEFQGDLALSLRGSLNLKGGVLTVGDKTPDAQVTLAAPYIRLDGGSWDMPTLLNEFQPGLFNVIAGGYKPAGHSSLALLADLIDIHGKVLSGARGVQGTGSLGNGASVPQVFNVLDGFADITLRSAGDVRLAGGLSAAGNIEVDAAQIYPLSGQNGALVAGLYIPDDIVGNPLAHIDPDSRLVIRSSTGTVPDVPYSVFGNLILMGGTVDQGGVVRAPLGTISLNTTGAATDAGGSLGTAWQAFIPADSRYQSAPVVILRGGSLTSVSAAGLEVPYGGTVDGVTYTGINQSGANTTQYYLPDMLVSRGDNSGTNRPDINVLATGVSIGAAQLVGEPGAVIDLSGGGVLHGEGFVTGRGGSVNVLKTPLANANPVAQGYSQPGNAVYAILPGYASDYAPVIADNGAGDPSVGAQITIGAGVPGLPAGTYTLLPSSFALMPGAFRVEVGGHVLPRQQAATTATPDGSWVTTAVQSTAGTGQRDALASQVLLTPGSAVRKYSQFNETTFSQFLLAQASTFGALRARLPEDGKILSINLMQDDDVADALQFDGVVRFGGVQTSEVTGVDGWMGIRSNNDIEIRPGESTATAAAGVLSLTDSSINAFAAPSLSIGGFWRYENGLASGAGVPRIYFGGDAQQHAGVELLAGATIKAGQVFLTGDAVNVDADARIDTRGFSGNVISSALGYVYAGNTSVSVLAVANDWLEFLPASGTGRISVADGASLLTEGAIVFSAPGGLDLGNVNLGARYLTVSQDQINLGTDASLAAADAAGVLPAGWHLTQDVLDKLLRPAATDNVPALERLSLTAGGAFNFYGSATLDTGDSAVQMVFNTPAFYGWGDSSDVVRIATGNLVWNGIATGAGLAGNPYLSQAPAAVLSGGAGTGTGQLVIDARTVEFGYDALSATQRQTALDRLVLGFAGVAVQASERVTANNSGTLTVGGTQAADGTRSGGDLLITTPLLTGQAGSNMSYTAGGRISVAAPVNGVAADTSAIADLGAVVALHGQSVNLDTAVALPSGKLSVQADGDITLGDGARMDLAGRPVAFFDVTKYSWGGDVTLTSAGGSIAQATGSRIDVSASNNDAGSLTLSAEKGSVALAGTLAGKGAAGFSDGQFGMKTGQMDSPAFSALNTRLNDGGFFGTRSAAIGHGDLVVGDGVHARNVSIAVNDGSLTVTGVIDASGTTPGSIDLAASGDMTLAPGAVLDAHGNVLAVDSYGAPIDASNRGNITLTSIAGTVRLASGVTLDLGTPDGVARGHIEINAARVSETGGDIRIDASGPVTIRGASSIAVNAFQTYQPPGADGTVKQDNSDVAGNPVGTDGVIGLDQIDARSAQFIDAAWGNGDLQGRLAGLTAYGAAFHLRPGVAIEATGNLTVAGDLDLSGYRYGPTVNAAIRGSGEPGVLNLRAGANLNIQGSINDGFAPGGGGPDGTVFGTVFSNETLTTTYTAKDGDVLSAGSVLPTSSSLGFALAIDSSTQIFASVSAPLPVDMVLVLPLYLYGADYPGAVLTGSITTPDGTVYPAGRPWNDSDLVYLPPGTIVGRGLTTLGMPEYGDTVLVKPVVLPKGTPVALLVNPTFGLPGYSLPADLRLQAGDDLSSGTRVSTLEGTVGERSILAASPMLSAGAQSWSIRLAAGADLASADRRAVLAPAHGGDLVLNNPFTVDLTGVGLGDPSPGISVIRTGTGDLELYAAGDYVQKTPFGVYTAGTAAADTGPDSIWNAPRELQADGTLLSNFVTDRAGYEALVGAQRMWYPTDGGNFSLSVGGNVSGFQDANTEMVGNWLWRQGGAELGQATAWGINFGTYLVDGNTMYPGAARLALAAFSGMGALGGGNVSVRAGGNIGADGSNTSHNIVVAVGSSGRVADGVLTQTGGGSLSVVAGGTVFGGVYAGLRGDTLLKADSVGVITLQGYGVNSGDPRGLDSHTPYAAFTRQAAAFAPGDGTVTVQTLGDLGVRALIDPGRTEERLETDATLADGTSGRAATWFTLWTNNTAIDLFSAGGNLSPLSTSEAISDTRILPPTLRAVAAGGNIYYTSRIGDDYLMPSPAGQLELLAHGLISGSSSNDPFNNGGAPFGLLGTPAGTMATPLAPAWRLSARGDNDDFFASLLATNNWQGVSVSDPSSIYGLAYDLHSGRYTGQGGTLFNFGQNTLTDDSMSGNGASSHIYALNGDLLNVSIGETSQFGSAYDGTEATLYWASKPVRMVAGGDIVNSGGLFAHSAVTDVSELAAGGNIYYQGGNIGTGVTVLGPGTLEVSAGGDIYLGNVASFTSQGPIAKGDTRLGADIAVQAGLEAGVTGVGGTDYDGFARRYLDPANLAVAGEPLADQPGKVAKTYEVELLQWLGERFGYTGEGGAAALAWFLALPAEQQRIFDRQVYFAELKAGGREYNDEASPRFNSYLRGRDAIAALFPNLDAQGQAIGRAGNLTLFQGSRSNAGIHTVAGGAIQTLTPGGQTLVGVEGLTPATADEFTAPSGLLTQGAGDIQMYSQGNILLGLSRIMTTFGGNIQAWSAQGDINAGRGSKTTLVYTPPKVVYDDYGNVALSPNVPSSGAGIATLNPIPEVPPGDVDLIAPLGTIDAGEAGIRVSGNINIAALHVVNAANIQVQGKSAGLPVVAAVNVSALTSASAAASAAANSAQDVTRQQQAAARNALPSVITVQVLGFGGEVLPGSKPMPPSSSVAPAEPRIQSARYDPANPVQILGLGANVDPSLAGRLTPAERKAMQQDQ